MREISHVRSLSLLLSSACPRVSTDIYHTCITSSGVVQRNGVPSMDPVDKEPLSWITDDVIDASIGCYGNKTMQ